MYACLLLARTSCTPAGGLRRVLGLRFCGRCPHYGAPGAHRTLQRAQLEQHEEWEEEIDDIVAQFEAETGRRPVYSICFY